MLDDAKRFRGRCVSKRVCGETENRREEEFLVLFFFFIISFLMRVCVGTQSDRSEKTLMPVIASTLAIS